jgi:VWFA-related protein
MRAALLTLALALPLAASSKILVTVIEQKTGLPVTDLKASDFSVLDDKAARKVEAAKYETGPVDALVLVDASLVGEMVRGLAASLIAELGEKEQMALVAFHSSPDLIQDFTSSKDTLLKALAGIKYGNNPRVLDAVYAAADGGFSNATYRRVILLVTSGFEGASRVTEKNAVQICRKNGVSVFPVYVAGRERGMLELLARQTGGASFYARDVGRSTDKPAARIFEAIRGRYELTVSGNLALGDKLKVEVPGPRKLLVSALPLD